MSNVVNSSVEALHKSLRENGIEFIRVLFCDNANLIRGNAFHREQVLNRYDCGVSIAHAQQAIPVMADMVVPATGLTPVGEVWLTPDWSTLQRLPYAPTHASVLGNMMLDQHPWAACPRHFLQRAITAAAAVNLTIKAAFENEFFLLQPTADGFQPVDQTPFAATYSMDCNQAVIDGIAQALMAQDIPVE